MTAKSVNKNAGLPRWLAEPIRISAHLKQTEFNEVGHPGFQLSARMQARLKDQGVSHLFPVQEAVLPRLLHSRLFVSSARAMRACRDLCVSAPTGSGKTLAYAIPIVETLSQRVVPRVRALVILPTRDLAIQVKATFDALMKGTDLRCALLIGQTSFAAEQNALVSTDQRDVWYEESGSSKVDVVVATPGRLVDHMKGTKGFSLQHLRFLVIDEADRLLNQQFQDWLTRVLNATMGSGQSERIEKRCTTDGLAFPLHRVTTTRLQDTVPDFGITSATDEVPKQTLVSRRPVTLYTPFQKLLFSATLTRNPAKIASLQLRNPAYIAVARAHGDENDEEAENVGGGDATSERYVIPPTLTEHMLVCPSAGEKPLVLLHLLYQLRVAGEGGVLIFAKSVETAHRLSALLKIFAEKGGPNSDAQVGITAAAFSSDLPVSSRRSLLREFRVGSVNCLICSDVMARGIDLGSEIVKAVINYDAPTRVKTYVHRVGRTARAGQSGDAYTIAEKKEARFFKQEVLAKVTRTASTINDQGEERSVAPKVKRIELRKADLDIFVPRYQWSLGNLGNQVHGHGEVKTPQKEEAAEPEVGELSDEGELDDEGSEDDEESSDSDDGVSDASDSDDDAEEPQHITEAHHDEHETTPGKPKQVQSSAKQALRSAFEQFDFRQLIKNI
ncbi:P-loop containing nucleoside triphosphate hydrolase protein [Cladochytrium replicatum]|nr:P-loop containing nucleoside triphosphate hydrolase protein [Cladochytrium replicatum]